MEKREIEKRIKEIEEEILRTQKNKATEHHLGKLKAKLARLREELKESKRRKGGKGFSVKKSGDATVGIVGFPSVGKSTLLNALTNAESKVGSYDFTTTEVVPGMMEHRGIKIQVLDFPGIISGASAGKGRGKEIISAVRVMDLILILLDVRNANPQFEIIKKELYDAGVRCNKRKPDVQVVKRGEGGIRVFKTPDVKLSERTIRGIASEYYVNADIIVRSNLTEDELIDVFLGNRVFLPAVVAINKIDEADGIDVDRTIEKIERDGWDVVAISAKYRIGIDRLKDLLLSKLELIRVYTKPDNKEPDFSRPLVIKKGQRVEDVCRKLHRDFVEKFKYAQVWGKSVKYPGQKVGLDHVLEDGDVISIFIRR